MTSITISAVRTRTSILDKSLSKGKGEVSLSCFALLFSELVQYCQNRVYTVPELQNKLAELGAEVGHRITDLLVVREKGGKREIKLLNILLFIKSTVWKSLFGREADKLEHANDDERTYYIIEKEALVNKFISVPKDKGSLNCASFIAGIVEAILCDCGFTAKVTAHWHKGTTYMVKFDDAVVTRDKQLEDR
ncbi:trafficking protein particle complex subunit 5 [Megachile rotundata]|uniref:trafficking protein particle complex subunit 5 n=1 Tax=Megachile rotundata TaxID=143995 RepID=UPI000258D64F|nr:PREDICTED: trafficking protein particle complex subunit 5 [Megachile rotundata]